MEAINPYNPVLLLLNLPCAKIGFRPLKALQERR